MAESIDKLTGLIGSNFGSFACISHCTRRNKELSSAQYMYISLKISASVCGILKLSVDWLGKWGSLVNAER